MIFAAPTACVSFKSCTTSVFHLLYYFWKLLPVYWIYKTAIGAKYCVGIGDKKNEELFHQMIGDVNDFLCGFSALGKELK